MHYLEVCKDESLEKEGWNLQRQSMGEAKSESLSSSVVSGSLPPHGP